MSFVSVMTTALAPDEIVREAGPLPRPVGTSSSSHAVTATS
jgi:hypothetical protein